MSNRPSASLVYGIEIDMPKDFEEFDLMMDEDENISYSHFGMADYDDDESIIIRVHKLGCKSGDYINELGKTLPIALPEHDKMLKDFCDKNNIPFKEPQWFVLGYYG